MTLCVVTKGHCLCQPDEGVFCPDYRPDAYVQCLMDAITELRKRDVGPQEARERASGDSARLDFIAKTLHIDGTGDEPIFAMFVPGVEPIAAGQWDAREIIDAGMAAAESSRTDKLELALDALKYALKLAEEEDWNLGEHLIPAGDPRASNGLITYRKMLAAIAALETPSAIWIERAAAPSESGK